MRATHPLHRLGRAAFVVSGLLFFARAILELFAGPPPSDGVAILAWVDSERVVLSFVSEVLFFATMTLIPAVAALYHSLASTERAKAVTGCGIIAVVIPTLVMSLIVHGRLVYPIYSMRVNTPAVAEFTVAIFYGGMHAVLLLMAVATFVLSLAMRREYGKPIAYLGFVTSVLDVAGSYPDAIGPVASFVCQLFFAGWYVALGLGLREPSTAI
jgi:hypothetical protein